MGRRQPCRKVLPDRSRAARDRANQKLVEYIVKTRGAESHLQAILRSRRPSRWLKTFLSSSQYVTCVETYLEDEEQLDLVVKYLQGVYQQMDGEVLARVSGDSIRFILDVLLPEVSPGAGESLRGWGAETSAPQRPLLGRPVLASESRHIQVARCAVCLHPRDGEDCVHLTCKCSAVSL